MSSKFTALLALAATLVAPAASAQSAAPSASDAKPLVRGSGTYKNVDYGYRVQLPGRVVYERSPAPFPNHGFQVPLATGDTLWVDASYTDHLSLADAVRGDEEMDFDCTEVQRQPTRLGVLPASELVYRCPSGVEERKVLALRGGILYTVGVSRRGGLSPAAAELFGHVRAAFTTMPR